jgi:hypothetical protein
MRDAEQPRPDDEGWKEKDWHCCLAFDPCGNEFYHAAVPPVHAPVRIL